MRRRKILIASLKSKWVGEPDGGDYDHDGDHYSRLASNISSLVQMRKMIIKGIVEEGNRECCDNYEKLDKLLQGP